ncbi:hypothetical protein [Streptomyces sp. NPDC127098]|uniref:hypothetical protein n=1 Tax=Streptomyces sp. NPDC127098 TaxID=3347137 RepID=UPI0036558AC5
MAYAHLESLIARPCGYLSNPLITRQLHHAADQSVRHPDYRPGPHWVKDIWKVVGNNPARAYRRARHRSGVWW